MSYYLGIDVGATHLRAAVATPEFDVVGRSTEPTPQESTPGAVSREVIRVAETALRECGVGPEAIAGAGIGSIGPLDREAGAVIEPANVESSRIELVSPLRELLDTDRIVLHNDTICGVIGEQQFARDATEDMVYLTFSTGIGAGVIVDDDVLSGNVGEVGHMTIDPTGTMRCGCGGGGHWEAYCGGANIPQYAAHLEQVGSVDTGLDTHGLEFTAEDVFTGTGTDELADLVVERIGYWNAIGVANVIHAFAPTYVAVGGAIALNNPDAILEPIRRGVPERVTIDVPEIKLTELGGDVVLRGALAAARRQYPPEEMAEQ